MPARVLYIGLWLLALNFCRTDSGAAVNTRTPPPSPSAASAGPDWQLDLAHATVSGLVARVSSRLTPAYGQALHSALAAPGPDYLLAISALFDDANDFLRALEEELLLAIAQGRLYARNGRGQALLGIQLVNDWVVLDDTEFALAAYVTASSNTMLRAGDWIVTYEGQPLAPGRDLGVLSGTCMDAQPTFLLGVFRNGVFAELRVRARFRFLPPGDIRARRCRDAIESIYLQRVAASLNAGGSTQNERGP